MSSRRTPDEVLDRLAADLFEAERVRAPRASLTSEVPTLSVADAYRIQTINVERRVGSGAQVRGHKVGLTSRGMQEHFAVTEPDYGHLLHDMFVLESSDVPFDRFIQPRVELEPAFALRRRLEGPRVTATDVIRATEFVVPSLEIIDSRIRDWDIRLQDTIADIGSSAAVVLGARPLRLCDLDLRDLRAALLIDGAEVAVGSTRDILGGPVNCVVWLANALAVHGVALEEGDVVLPGTPVVAQPVARGQTVTGRFEVMGSVEVSFA